MAANFDVENDFLTGSYGRHTKTKPLKDVDIFVVLGEAERWRLSEPSSELLEAVRLVLVEEYGGEAVSTGRRCVQVNFGGSEDDEKVMSIDVVPSFTESADYKIADPHASCDWTLTNSKHHAGKATACNKAFSNQWKPIVKMVKKWNAVQGKPIKPSFLIEVVAIELLRPPFSGGYPYEIKGFLAALHDRIEEQWDDPAGLGPPVSDQMDLAACANARRSLVEAGRAVDIAIQYERVGNIGAALKTWRESVFGSQFPLS